MNSSAQARLRRRLQVAPPGDGIPSAEVTAPNGEPIILPPWIFPPDRWENIDLSAYVALPAVGANAAVIQFTVPLGRHGIIKKIANNLVGGGWTEGSGSVVWQILIDGAPPPGANSYNNILDSLGSPANPVEIAGFRIFENQVVTLVVQNVALAVAGQLVGGRFIGYLYPREMEMENVWI